MSERDELVARLRKDVYYGDARLHNMSRHNPLHADAADQIERDKRVIERLREALYAINYEYDPSEGSGNAREMYDIARAALRSTEESK